MHVDVIAVSVQVVVEHEWRVHERAGVNKTSPLLDFHLLDVEYEAAVEDMESHCALPTKKNDLIVSDLVRKPHVRRHPVGLVHLWAGDLLPQVPRNVVDLDGVNDPLLVDSASESEDVVVLESAERHASSWHSHLGDDLPLVLLGVVDLAVAIDLVSHKGPNDVDEVLDGADRVVCVREDHVSDRVQSPEKVIVSVAVLQVHTSLLQEATRQIDGARLCGNGARVEGHFVVHLHLLLLEDIGLQPVELNAPLIPLE